MARSTWLSIPVFDQCFAARWQLNFLAIWSGTSQTLLCLLQRRMTEGSMNKSHLIKKVFHYLVVLNPYVWYAESQVTKLIVNWLLFPDSQAHRSTRNVTTLPKNLYWAWLVKSWGMLCWKPSFGVDLKFITLPWVPATSIDPECDQYVQHDP